MAMEFVVVTGGAEERRFVRDQIRYSGVVGERLVETMSEEFDLRILAVREELGAVPLDGGIEGLSPCHTRPWLVRALEWYGAQGADRGVLAADISTTEELDAHVDGADPVGAEEFRRFGVGIEGQLHWWSGGPGLLEGGASLLSGRPIPPAAECVYFLLRGPLVPLDGARPNRFRAPDPSAIEFVAVGCFDGCSWTLSKVGRLDWPPSCREGEWTAADQRR